MEHQQDNNNSLQHRVDNYLRGKPTQYAQEASEEDVLAVFYDLLKRTEKDLETAQERVDRLKWELAKVQSESS